MFLYDFVMFGCYIFLLLDYALINRECGPYAKIFVVTSCLTDRTKGGPCGMTSQQIFSVWTKLKVNKSFIVYPHK